MESELELEYGFCFGSAFETLYEIKYVVQVLVVRFVSDSSTFPQYIPHSNLELLIKQLLQLHLLLYIKAHSIIEPQEAKCYGLPFDICRGEGVIACLRHELIAILVLDM